MNRTNRDRIGDMTKKFQGMSLRERLLISAILLDQMAIAANKHPESSTVRFTLDSINTAMDQSKINFAVEQARQAREQRQRRVG